MKIPDDAFERYVALGPGRSYQALADKLGVDKRSITRLAAKENWVERLAKIQEEARAATNKKLVADLQAVRERQLQQARFLQAQALKALKELPPEKALKAAASALSASWRQEMLILGEPTDRHAATVEEVTKREIETLLIRDDEPDGWERAEREVPQKDDDDDPDAPG